METSGVFAASNSCCLRDYRLNDKNMFSLCISLPWLPLVIIMFYLVWWWGLVFSVSVIKIFKGFLGVCQSFSFLSISTFDLFPVQCGVDGKLDVSLSLSDWDSGSFISETESMPESKDYTVSNTKSRNVTNVTAFFKLFKCFQFFFLF